MEAMTDPDRKDGLAPRESFEVTGDTELPIVARLIVEVRSDGRRTVARGLIEDTTTGRRTQLAASGANPVALLATVLDAGRTFAGLAWQAARKAARLRRMT
jgi:hypothetical protein